MNKDLRQIYYLNREVEMWQEELFKLENQSLINGHGLAVLSAGGEKTDKVAERAVSIEETKAIIKSILAELQQQRKEMIRFINAIEDSMLRQIFFYRCVSCLNWYEVADLIGGDNTAAGVRQQYHRYLKTCHTCHRKQV